jgi:hypothetical protein
MKREGKVYHPEPWHEGMQWKIDDLIAIFLSKT